MGFKKGTQQAGEDKVTKKSIVVFTVVAVIAGILTGLLASSLLFGDEQVIAITDGDNKSEGGSVTQVESKNRKKGTQAKYKITKGQKYYTNLVDKDDTNILVVGEDATSGNWDTIIIASLSDKNKKIQLMNIPRDMYVDYSDEVLNQLREKSPKLYQAKGFQKINAAHSVGSRIKYEDGAGEFQNSDFDFLADLIEEVFDITIHDYAYANTKGFRDVVDLFDGVDINVPVRMKYDDPLQNLHIDLQPGPQHLNGVQAEGFVRFRQGYDKNGAYKNYSDQFRKENQNEFMKAFFKQHITLKNLGKVDELSALLGKNLKTSVSGAKTIASYVNMLRKALTGKYTQESIVIECDKQKTINGIFFDILKTK